MDIGKNIRDFSFLIAKRLNEEEEEQKNNVSFSPTSLYLSLAMLNIGSQETTRDELKALLGFDYSILLDTNSENYGEITEAIYTVLSSLETSTELNNKIYSQIKINKDYGSSLGKIFKAIFEEISFNEPEKAAIIINEWVNKKTKGMIKDLIKESEIDSNTRLILINTIYFKSFWDHKFDKSASRKEKFYLENGMDIEVDMMISEYRADVYEDETSYLCLKKIFKNSQIVGIFILPPEGKNLQDFISSFTSQDLLNCINKTRKMQIKVYIPKCTIKMDKNMCQTLKKCGLISVFDPVCCNLKGMALMPLFVSNICHSSTVSISEDGVEAAAATSIKIVLRSVISSFEFIVNRPFVFMICDSVKNIPLFINLVYDPTK